ncbi:MAG: Hpt domain-containing protein [Pirellulales bacterium]
MSEVAQDELLAGFIYESIDLLRDLPDQLETYCSNPADGGPLDGVFRSVHTIMGNAGFFGLVQIKKFSHSLENTLDEIRKQTIALDESLTRVLVDGFDLLDAMLDEVQEGALADELAAPQQELLDRIEELTKDSRSGDPLEQVLLLLSELNEEIASADVEFSATWSARIHQIQSELTGEDSPQEDASPAPGDPQDSSENLTPEQWIDTKFQCQGHDITSQVRPLLEWFLTVDKGGYSKSMGQTFLDLLHVLIDGAKENGDSPLQEGLSATFQNGRMIFQSSMDFDHNLAAIL